jgi:leader peptidase (prepilin peptidase)/N-methyltransferase
MNLAYIMILTVLMVVISLIDIHSHIIPNVLITLGFGLAIGFNLNNPENLMNSAISMAIIIIIFLAFYIGFKGKLGAGDIKLAAFAGFITGYPEVFIAIFLFGLLSVVVTLVYYKFKKAAQTVPYAPVLAIGCLISMIYGTEILGILRG